MFKNVFNIDPEFDTKFLQFSQRRFAGFRSKIEFDKKRLILSNRNSFQVYGYDNYAMNNAHLLLE